MSVRRCGPQSVTDRLYSRYRADTDVNQSINQLLRACSRSGPEFSSRNRQFRFKKYISAEWARGRRMVTWHFRLMYSHTPSFIIPLLHLVHAWDGLTSAILQATDANHTVCSIGHSGIEMFFWINTNGKQFTLAVFGERLAPSTAITNWSVFQHKSSEMRFKR